MPDTSLLDFAKAFANTMTKTDFEAAFKKVVDLVQAILKRHEQAIQSLEHEHKELYQHLRNEHASSLTELKTKTNQLFVEDRLGSMHSETKAGFSKLQSSLNEMFGSKVKELESRVAELKPIKGDRGDKGDKGDTGPMPTEHLQLMKDMMAEVKRIQNILENIPRGRGGSRGKVPMLSVIDLTTSFDGLATTATVPRDTVKVHMVWSTQFPQILRPDVDFTLRGQTLTLVTREVGTIESGQTVVALIETLFYQG